MQWTKFRTKTKKEPLNQTLDNNIDVPTPMPSSPPSQGQGTDLAPVVSLEETSSKDRKPSQLIVSPTPADWQMKSSYARGLPTLKEAYFGAIMQIDGNDDIDSESNSDDEKQEDEPGDIQGG